ncbi:MAG: hypothetical protein ACLTF6_01770 [Clostridium sp.]
MQQATNCHVFIVHIPDGRLVFHSQSDHWMTKKELREMFDLFKELQHE